MSSTGFSKVRCGEYTGTVEGVAVRVVRLTVGTNAYGERSRKAEWRAYSVATGARLSDGNGTMAQAVSGAAAAVRVRGSK